MGASRKDGFSERAIAPYTATASVDFVQAERERLRAGLLDAAPVTSPDDPRLVEAMRMPSPKSEDVTARALGKFAELWRTRHQSVLANLPIGAGVGVDLASGLFITAPRRIDAHDVLDQTFGADRSAWLFEHGVPVTLGGGLWALNSEA